MNRFLLFSYFNYYPRGGMDDCAFMSNEPHEIVNTWKNLTADFQHVYDCESGRQYDSIQEFVDRFPVDAL